MNETLEITLWIVGLPLSWLLVAFSGILLQKFFNFLGKIIGIENNSSKVKND
jgi:hypothetical protein